MESAKEKTKEAVGCFSGARQMRVRGTDCLFICFCPRSLDRAAERAVTAGLAAERQGVLSSTAGAPY
jgi:hypothetical protein